jgi:hypothetical protein
MAKLHVAVRLTFTRPTDTLALAPRRDRDGARRLLEGIWNSRDETYGAGRDGWWARMCFWH